MLKFYIKNFKKIFYITLVVEIILMFFISYRVVYITLTQAILIFYLMSVHSNYYVVGKNESDLLQYKKYGTYLLVTILLFPLFFLIPVHLLKNAKPPTKNKVEFYQKLNN